MVNLVEDWEVPEEYAGDKQGFHQILEGYAETEKIRVAIGRRLQEGIREKGGHKMRQTLVG